MSEIETFLQARPNASDTVEGIHAWWINWPSSQHIICTEVALQFLEERGIVESFKLGGRILWRKVKN